MDEFDRWGGCYTSRYQSDMSIVKFSKPYSNATLSILSTGRVLGWYSQAHLYTHSSSKGSKSQHLVTRHSQSIAKQLFLNIKPSYLHQCILHRTWDQKPSPILLHVRSTSSASLPKFSSWRHSQIMFSITCDLSSSFRPAYSAR